MNALLRTLLIALALCVLAPPANAAPPGQTYRITAAGKEQRDSDPFVFCRYGMKKKYPAWKPIPPYTFGYMPMPGYCPIPMMKKCCFGYVCFLPWPKEDYYAYTSQYVFWCPQPGAGRKKWDGSGDGTRVDSNGTNVH